jgi:lysine 2,3-aminomutase
MHAVHRPPARSERARAFLDAVEDPRYTRGVVKGIDPFLEGRVPREARGLYAADELAALRALRGTDRDVEARMPVKVTRHYAALARHSPALQRIIKADPGETLDLTGTDDPGHQMDYSPVEGLLHKYEMALVYAVSTCSAHCRFCYREELIAGKRVKRADGTVARKGLARLPEVAAYVRAHNRRVAKGGGVHPETGRPKLREVLLSGGDPMVLSNACIAAWLSGLAEAGVEVIRLGTKEMAFHPDRFDDAFLGMMDAFHAAYPDVAFRLMVHFDHPHEFLLTAPGGAIVEDPGGLPRWHPSTRRALDALKSRGWIDVENQAPIIRGVNDDAEALRVLQRELKRVGVENHYFFCGRDIVAHRSFNVPIERAWQLLNASQKGLSGVEAHARLSITHYKGKTEVVTVTGGPIAGVPASADGVVVFKLLRSAADAPDRGKAAIVGRNPEALWFDGYEDRVILDEAGLFGYARTPVQRVRTTMRSRA